MQRSNRPALRMHYAEHPHSVADPPDQIANHQGPDEFSDEISNAADHPITIAEPYAQADQVADKQTHNEITHR